MKAKTSISRWLVGSVMLLAAASVVANQIGDFAEIGIVSIVIAALAAIIMIQCIVNFSFYVLPFPLGVLYYVFQEPLALPHISFWTLLVVVALAWIGLYILMPKRHKHCEVNITGSGRRSGGYDGGHGYVGGRGEGCRDGSGRPEPHTEGGDGDNNPSVSVHFGATSRYLHSDNLESVYLDCKFGSLEIFLDHAQLSPNGAEVFCQCSFGSIEISVPRHWRVIDEINCTFSGVEVDNRRACPTQGSPELTVKGNVSFGGIEIKYI